MANDFGGVRSERLPSDDDFTCGFRMDRAQAGRTKNLIIFSADMLGMRTHYFRGRTGPCWEKGCEACARNMRSRWNGYVLGVLMPTEERVIFEFTPPAGRVLDEAFKEYNTMRGLKVTFSRTSEKVNARVHAQVKGMWDNAHTIKRVPETWPVLMHIWGLTKMDSGIVGPMAAQEVSEAEMLEGTSHPSKVRSRNKIPQASLLKPPPAAAVQASANELLDAIARSTFADGGSAARVNGAKNK